MHCAKRVFLYVVFMLVSVSVISTQVSISFITDSLIAGDVTGSNQTTAPASINESDSVSDKKTAATNGHFEGELPDLPIRETVSDVSPNPTFIITLHGMIDGGLSSSLRRRIKVAEDNDADMIIFDINTFGGRLDSAIEISENISGIKDIKTVAFISHKAISAGALIAISCKRYNYGA